ncbi:MAG: Ger(x)C family spore germination protein [Clostridia bacterium]
MKHRIMLSLLGILLLTGCWDNVEIHERGYVLGVAIDKAQPIPKGQEPEKDYLSERDIEKMPLQQDKAQYAYTLQIPVVAKAKNRPAGAGAGSQGDATWDMTIIGNSFMEANREFSTRIENPPFYEHLQAIVISEDVAREGVSKVLDLFLRDPEMRRRTRLFIAPGEAKKIINVAPRIEDYPSLYLAGLSTNFERTARMVYVADLGQISENLHAGIDFVLPRVVATKDEIKNAGAAVFKGDKMVGWLGEIDVIFLLWVRNYVQGGVIVIEDTHEHKGLVTLEVLKVDTKVRPMVEGDKIKMSIDIKAQFNIAEKYEIGRESAFDDEYIKRLEKKAADYIKEQIQDTIKYVQKKYGTDIFFFGLQMKRYQPKVWKQVEDDWDDIFKDIETEITVKARIKQIGTMK